MIPRFDIATLFVDMCRTVTDESIIGRAQRAGKLSINYYNIRDYACNKHNRVDDCTYGGGKGMLLQAGPIYRCYEDICKTAGGKPYVIFPSPQGKVLTQAKAVELSQRPHMMLLCGHYEGVDQRVLDEIVDEEISLGDFVLTGGELPAMAILDAVARLCPGVLSEESCFTEESLYHGLLEYPQYSHPALWDGREVPPVLLTGHHANITKWRREQSLLTTWKKRPELLEQAELTKKDLEFLERLRAEESDGERVTEQDADGLEAEKV